MQYCLYLLGIRTSDEFYPVARSISNDDWKEFARSPLFLNLPENIVDDIIFNERHSIIEQKYQMLLKWQQMLGKF